MKKAKGFSLIELMLVVAIVGVLSAIIIPTYQEMQAEKDVDKPHLIENNTPQQQEKLL